MLKTIGLLIFLALCAAALYHTDAGDWRWFVEDMSQLPRIVRDWLP